MKKVIKNLLTILFTVFLIGLMCVNVFAHSGRTDGSGGHKDNKNASGLGSYHYHCGGYPAHLHNSGYCPYTDVFPSSVKITSSKTVLGIGENIELSATVYPSNACSTRVNWESSDSSVVSVSNGKIVAKKYGKATITAETFNKKKASVTIIVKEITAEKVTVAGVPEQEHYYIGAAFDLTAAITPENVDNPSIVWSSSDVSLATVSETGSVKLLSKGTVEIRATASNGVVGKAVINVEEKYVETVDITEDEKELLLLENYELTSVVTPNDATYPKLTWTVADPAVVSVSENGTITALSCGETIVTATSTNGISDIVRVRVTEIKAESLELVGPTEILVGSEATLTWNILPADTTVRDVVLSVSDDSLASITEDGVFTAENVGKVTVTAKQKDVSDELIIEILPIDVENVVITNDAESIISKGDTVVFFAEVSPDNATYSDITWSVSDPSIASIDEDGVLSALRGGFVTVAATSGDGFVAECSLFIFSPVFAVFGVGGIGAVIAGIVVGIKKKKK